jgi:DNA-binding PadR family transcriptional regulator
MRGKGELSSALAIAIAVSCFLLLDTIDVGFSDCLESYGLDSAQTLCPAILGVSSFFFGRTKVLAKKDLFTVSSSKLGYPSKNQVTVLDVFKGRAAKLNLFIFWALDCKEPQTTREIFKKINQITGRKHFSYSTVNRRVRDLEEHLYLKKTEVRQRAGGITNYYELRPKALLAKFLNSTNMNNLLEKVNDETALTLLEAFLNVNNNVLISNPHNQLLKK